MAISDVYERIAQVLVVAWVYCLYLNAGWFCTVGAFAESKHGFQGCAICLTGARIRNDNLSAVPRRSRYLVEDIGDGFNLIRIITGKCEDWATRKARSQLIISSK